MHATLSHDRGTGGTARRFAAQVEDVDLPAGTDLTVGHSGADLNLDTRDGAPARDTHERVGVRVVIAG